MTGLGRFREKTEEELIWDDTRQTILRLVDLEIQKQRRRILNVVLPAAHKKHLEAIKRGDLKELETEYTELAAAVVKGIIPEHIIANALGEEQSRDQDDVADD